MSKENLKKDTLDKNIWTVLSNSNIALEEELLNKSKLNEAIRAIGIILTKEDLREQFFQPKKREQLEKIIKNADHLFQSILWKNSALGPQLIDAVKNSIGEDYPNIKIIKGILSLRLPTKNADGTEYDDTVHHMISKLYNLPKIKGNNIEYDSEYGSEYGSESEFTPQDNTADKMSSDVKNLLENSNSKDTSGKWLTYENYVKNSMRNYVNDFNYRSEYYDYEPPEYHEEPEKFLQQCRIKFIESCFYRIPNSRSFQEKVGHKISEELRELNNKMLEGIWDIKRESFLPKNNRKLEQQEEILKAYLLKLDQWWDTKQQDVHQSLWKKFKEFISCTLEIIKFWTSPTYEEKLDNFQYTFNNIIRPNKISKGLAKIPDIKITPHYGVSNTKRSFKERTNKSSSQR